MSLRSLAFLELVLWSCTMAPAEQLQVCLSTAACLLAPRFGFYLYRALKQLLLFLLPSVTLCVLMSTAAVVRRRLRRRFVDVVQVVNLSSHL